MVAAGLWIVSNWRWALPTLLCVGLAGYCGLLKYQLNDRDLKLANVELEKREAVIEALRKQQELHDEDNRNNQALLEALRINKAAIQKELSDAQREIEATPRTKVCIDTDAARAFRRSLRPAPDASPASPIQPGPAAR